MAIEARVSAIASSRPGAIDILTDPSQLPQPLLAAEALQHEEVSQNDQLIAVSASRYNVDPELVRALIWYTSTDPGFGSSQPTESAGALVTPMPTPSELWKDLKVTESDLASAQTNIAVGTFVLSQLQNRLLDPTPEKLYSVYLDLAASSVSVEGKTASWYLEHRPWSQSAADLANLYDLREPQPKPVSAGGSSSPLGVLSSIVLGATPDDHPREFRTRLKLKDFEGAAVDQAKKQAWAEAKKSAENASVNKDLSVRGLPKSGAPRSEYKFLEKEFADKQQPEVKSLYSQLKALVQMFNAAFSEDSTTVPQPEPTDAKHRGEKKR